MTISASSSDLPPVGATELARRAVLASIAVDHVCVGRHGGMVTSLVEARRA